jgi:SAM-dependent methyltransferase
VYRYLDTLDGPAALLPVPDAPELYDWTHRNAVDDFGWYKDFVGSAGVVLEAATGSGRVLLELAAAGHRVIGLDNSATMLNRLRSKLGPRTSPNTHTVLADMRQMPVASASLDRVICPFSSFNYLTTQEDQLRFLRETRRVLAPDGRFSFEILGFSLRDGWLTNTGRPVLVDSGPASGPHDPRTIELWSTIDFDSSSQLVSELRYYRVLESGREVEAHSVSWLNRFVLPGEMALLLDAAGLRVLGVHGDYAGGPIEHTSSCLVYVCAPD